MDEVSSSKKRDALQNTEPLSRLCLGGEIVQVPTAIVEQESMFRDVITKEAYRMLTPEAQNYLKRFLPKYEGAEADEERILECVFTSDPNFHFGNSLAKVYSKIKCGWFNPERTSDQVQLKDNRRLAYDHYIRYYYISLLKKLLVARHRLLKQVANLGAGEELSSVPPSASVIRKRKSAVTIRTRANHRVKLMLDDVKVKAGDTEPSSDEEEEAPSPNAIPLTAAGRSTLYSPDFVDLDLHQPIHMDDVKKMLKEYQRLKETEPDSPSLDITNITLEDVYERAGVTCIAEKNLPAEITEAMKLPFRSSK
ncbi:hypothetical protein AB6A40_000275 [Gnathostoma spinigerum]|uniref:Uncharacterized protein n=1 Tax=Gnathostoma spinigerum TaxID=75299 RepID=A0ABD6E311_9BILA